MKSSEGAARRNLLANFGGQALVSLISFALIPVYVRWLGIESYALIGVFTLLMAFVSLIQMVFAPTVNREMARFTGHASSPEEIRDLIKSIATLAIGAGLVVVVTLSLLAPLIATKWLKAETLDWSAIRFAVMMMGAIMGLGVVEAVYRSVVFGLQRQVIGNLAYIAIAVIRGFGAIAVLALLSSSVQAFFLWQLLMAIFSLVTFRIICQRALPHIGRKPHFSKEQLRSVSSFATGTFLVAFFGLILTQMDKIILSGRLSLTEFGYYALASAAAGTLFLITAPIITTFFPRLSELIAVGDDKQTERSFHLAAQIVTVTVGSMAAVLSISSLAVIKFWTNDSGVALAVAPILTLLAIGALLNCLWWMPFHLQLSFGWTELALKMTVGLVCVALPTLVVASSVAGAAGAAWTWIGVNVIYIIVGVPLMFRKVLKGNAYYWFKWDFLLPLGAAFVVAAILGVVFSPFGTSWVGTGASLILTGFFSLLASAATAPLVRRSIISVTEARFRN